MVVQTVAALPSLVALGVWVSRNALPAVSIVPLQGAQSFGTKLYTIVSPTVKASEGLHAYDSTTDLWATGSPSPPSPCTRARPREHALRIAVLCEPPRATL